ncbi:MAG TPA: acyltransferase [Flavisolibacter sp.]|nr:acyltransferase [Flavisolibacter sp.]
MTTLIAKAIRLFAKQSFTLTNFFRIIYLRLKYPGLRIDLNSRIEKGCKIICVDGGKMHIQNSFISSGTHLMADAGGDISIKGAFIGRNCLIVSKKKIELGEGCAIAEMVVIRDQNHKIDFNDLENTLYNFDIEEIVIGKNVWIGAKATILKGVTIGEQSVVAASAVVTKSILPGQIWGGVPARYIKDHDNNINRTEYQVDIQSIQNHKAAG